MINEILLILILRIFHFKLMIFLFRHPMVSQLVRCARVSSHVDDFNTRNEVLTAKLLKQDIYIINFVRRFQSFIVGILT